MEIVLNELWRNPVGFRGLVTMYLGFAASENKFKHSFYSLPDRYLTADSMSPGNLICRKCLLILVPQAQHILPIQSLEKK